MDINEGNQNKNALIAIVLSGIVLFGWNYLFPSPTYEAVEKTKSTDSKSETKTSSVAINDEVLKVDTGAPSGKSFILTNDKATFKFTSNLKLLDVVFHNTDRAIGEIFPDFDNQFVILVDGKPTSEKLEFSKLGNNVVKVSSSDLVGEILLNSLGQLEFNFTSERNLQLVASLTSSEASKNQQINNFVYYTDELKQIEVGDDPENINDLKLSWAGIDFNYHIFGIVLPKNKLYHVKTNGGEMKLANLKGSQALNFKLVFLKKNYDELANMGDKLKNSVDFGIWSIIALPMLRGLQYFYTLLNNWGLAIIILTIIIRMVMFPLQHTSFKNMKKMQVLQPEMKKIRERYKEEPQKMQQETMALFKKHKTNPMGGCLPLFLQMPIFFAFYRMLYNSVELVDAPFYFWIQDLSEKDPYYVLPVLVGIAMFFNMKLTPQTTMDPAQQKVMKFMPLIFSIFLVTLPSGLNLYILVSTIVGMSQQIFVYRRTA